MIIKSQCSPFLIWALRFLRVESSALINHCFDAALVESCYVHGINFVTYCLSISQRFTFFFLSYFSETLYNFISHITESIHKVSMPHFKVLKHFKKFNNYIVLVFVHVK